MTIGGLFNQRSYDRWGGGGGGGAIGRGGMGRANSGPSQNRAWSKLARFFLIKILTAQSALKIRPIEPNSIFKAKKIRAGRAGPAKAIPGRAKFGLIFFGPIILWPTRPKFRADRANPSGRDNFATFRGGLWVGLWAFKFF